MELQLVMETSSESLGSAVWLTSSFSPTYQQILPGDDITDQQTSLDYEETQNNVWQSKQISPKGSPENHHHQHHDHPPSSSPLSSCSQSPEYKLLISQTNLQEQQSQALKRCSDESHQHQHEVNEPERKVLRKNGGNSSMGWSTQVEEIAEHLAVDYDGSLSALAASHLATAVASYNMSEALLALPSLTVFKQEAPSPENQHNQILNHVSQKTSTDSLANNGNNSLVEADSINSGRNPTNLHQLIYSSSDDYSSNSTCGNHVSSSQQENEFNEKCCFQYVLAAATSIATKVNEETLTYLNQGQSYEIKLKKLGDLSTYRGKLLKSTIRICFHERRLQYTEREQILAWQQARPGERLLEVDVPLSYGMIDVCEPSSSYNSVDFTWNPNKEIGCCIKINCISTEFTPKKHGGEKGVPFRIQVETRLPSGTQLHAASCKIKVFKLKGADRKHKQDRDKIQRRPPHEQDKYQPSYDCTILSDIPLDTLTTSNSVNQNVESPCTLTDSISPQSQGTSGSSSPVSVPPVALSSNAGTAPIISTSESNQENVEVAPTLSLPPTILPQQTYSEINVKSSQGELPANANAAQTCSWLRAHHFHAFESTFTSFSAADILRLSRDDLIQICGLADGIRLFNALHARAPQPKLSLYFAMETGGGAAGLWRAIYLKSLTSASLTSKLLDTLGFSRDRLHSVLILGPQGIHVLVTNELIANMKDESMFVVETIKEPITDRYKLLLKPSSH